MKKIVIFGAGGLGRETITLINYGINYYSKKYELLGFVVEEKYYQPNTIINGYPVLGTTQWLIDHRDDVCCTIAIGDYSYERERIFKMLDENGVELETLICGDAFVPPTCKIGKGCYIGTGVVFSVNSVIGDGVFINSQCMFGHDVKIGEFCTFYPRATISGNCTIGRHAKIGGGSYIVPKRKIGDDAVVASGSVVFTNVRAGTTVIGNPARRMKEIE